MCVVGALMISEEEYDELPIETARKFKWCHRCGGFYNYHRLIECPCCKSVVKEPEKEVPVL